MGIKRFWFQPKLITVHWNKMDKILKFLVFSSLKRAQYELFTLCSRKGKVPLVCSAKSQILAAAAKSLQLCPTVQPRGRQPTRLPRPWDSPGKNTGVGCHFPLQCMKVKSESKVAQLCPTPSDPMDSSPPGSSVHGIFQARVLAWGAIAFSSQILNKSLMHMCWMNNAEDQWVSWFLEYIHVSLFGEGR